METENFIEGNFREGEQSDERGEASPKLKVVPERINTELWKAIVYDDHRKKI